MTETSCWFFLAELFSEGNEEKWEVAPFPTVGRDGPIRVMICYVMSKALLKLLEKCCLSASLAVRNARPTRAKKGVWELESHWGFYSHCWSKLLQDRCASAEWSTAVGGACSWDRPVQDSLRGGCSFGPLDVLHVWFEKKRPDSARGGRLPYNSSLTQGWQPTMGKMMHQKIPHPRRRARLHHRVWCESWCSCSPQSNPYQGFKFSTIHLVLLFVVRVWICFLINDHGRGQQLQGLHVICLPKSLRSEWNWTVDWSQTHVFVWIINSAGRHNTVGLVNTVNQFAASFWLFETIPQMWIKASTREHVCQQRCSHLIFFLLHRLLSARANKTVLLQLCSSSSPRQMLMILLN